MNNYTQKIKGLLKEMTLREKLAQMSQTVAGYRCFERNGEEFALKDEFKNFISNYGAMGAISNFLPALNSIIGGRVASPATELNLTL